MEKISVAQARQGRGGRQAGPSQGWVRTRRDSKGGFSFLELNDGSCLGNVQVIAEAALPNYEVEVKQLTAGCSVTVDGRGPGLAGQGAGDRGPGRRASSSTAGPTPRRIRCRRRATRSSSCATIAHLRPRTNTFGAVARVRNCVCRSIHDFFQEQGFLYVHPPIITASDCEGAGQMFQVTTLDLGQAAAQRDGRSTTRKDFFGRPTYLTVSGQLEAEIFACALGKVYTFGPTFRAENSNTSRHLAEFWMVEPEMAFFELTDNMDLAEAFLKRICPRRARTAAPRTCSSSTSASTRRRSSTLEGIVNSEFVRLPYTEAVDILEKSGQTFEFPVAWGIDLQAEHERYLTEKHFKKPVILYDYPRDDQAVLHAAQRRRQDGAGDGRAGAAASARSSAAASARSGSTCWSSG